MKKTLLAFAFLCAAGAMAIEGWRVSPYEVAIWERLSRGEKKSCAVSPIGFGAAVCVMGEAGNVEMRAAMAERLNLLTDFSQAYARILARYAQLSVSNQTFIAMAPSLWSEAPRVFDRDYLHTLRSGFGAEAGVLVDVDALNEWTLSVTDGRAKDMMRSVPQGSELELCNAFAFEGAWPVQFTCNYSHPEAFASADGVERNIPYLTGEAPVLRFAHGKFDAYIIPLAAVGLHFAAILPHEGLGTDDILAKALDYKTLDEIKASVRLGFGDRVTSGVAKIKIPVIDIVTKRNILPPMREYAVPERGFSGVGANRRLTGARMVTSILMNERGVSLTPGVAAQHQLDEIAKREQAKRQYYATGKKQEEREQQPRLDDIALERPFLFFVWDSVSNTMPVCGTYK
ncbi:MAG: hypothetical protein IJ802_02990 [Kiritimatiellae bacterium]|nr:hypothetical protein [Kiritimatiellia bacterium]